MSLADKLDDVDTASDDELMAAVNKTLNVYSKSYPYYLQKGVRRDGLMTSTNTKRFYNAKAA